MNLSSKIKLFAKSIGFHLVQIIPAVPISDEKEHFENWLQKGYEGDLQYMKEAPEKRTNIQKILPGAKSIISLAMNYYQPELENVPKNAGKIARYAWGKDYHTVIEKKLKKIRHFIMENTEKALQKIDFKLYVDAGPVLERSYAAKAGLGFIGKNTMLITQQYGSWVFLAEIITTLPLEYDQPPKPLGRCGTCTRCIDACPTKAIVKPYEVDARKCISYQTIENKDEIPPEVREKMGDRIFGCDICQEVCPHNCRAKKTDVEEFLKHRAGPHMQPEKITALNEKEFDEKFKASPVKRAGLKGLLRNTKHML
jgi:epoxyqueuosine reductase